MIIYPDRCGKATIYVDHILNGFPMDQSPWFVLPGLWNGMFGQFGFPTNQGFIWIYHRLCIAAIPLEPHQTAGYTQQCHDFFPQFSD